jgi:lysophospholipase L1-like esterase
MEFIRVLPLFALLALTPALAQTSIRVSAAVPAANGEETDFAQMHHYRDANAALSSAAARRVVFLGDSITQYWGWHNGTWFPQKEWINRGIGGQTTQQLLLRERHDALDLHPDAMVIEGGANDMRLGFSPEAIRDNVATIAELARAHGITVFIAGMTPVCDCVRPLTGLRTVDRIHRLNALLQQLCREQHWVYLDFNTPLAAPDGLMRKELTVDGVHPNDAGYKLLEPVVNQALRAYR